MNKYKFKFNLTTESYSRVILKSDGKAHPYQNELVLTPSRRGSLGYPGTPEFWKDIRELTFVKYFHQNQPKSISYCDELPEETVKQIKEVVGEKMFDIMMNFEFNDRLIHVNMGTGGFYKAKDCLLNSDELFQEARNGQ